MACARAIAIAILVMLLAPPAMAQSAAPDKNACVTSFDRGQRAQSDRALRRALGELIVCAQESCPTVLKADCAGVLAEVRAALPTIVFAADDGNGHELTDVKVFGAGQLLAPRLDGHAIPVDPGTFDLRFESPGRKPLVTSRTIREGEKSRVIRVSLTDLAGASSDRVESPHRSALGWALPISLAALGVAALGFSAYQRIRFDDRVEELRGSCAPECSQSDRSDVSGTLVASNVSLGVGIGVLALAVTSWFLTAPPAPASTSRAAALGRFTW